MTMQHRRYLDGGPQRPTTAGFTLIELMITVAIVGILAAIALPSYLSYVQRGDRAAARAGMLEAQQFMERFYASNNTFAVATLPTRLVNIPIGASKYTISVDNLAANTFTLTATPTTTLSKCGNLTLTHTGVKGVSIPSTPSAADIAACWR